MKKRSSYIALSVALTVVVAATVAVITAATAFYGRAVEGERHLYIRRDTPWSEVSSMLDTCLRHRTAFALYARRIGLDRSCRAGHYVLREDMNVIAVARMLKSGMQTPVRVTVNNVRIPAELAGKLSRMLEADSASLVRVLTSAEAAREVGFDSLTLFSMFIPNTYELYWTTTPEELLKRMRREYDAFWTPARDEARRRCGMSRFEVMTLASILWEETKAVDEMPRIAGVYINRLRRGMPLQADPTVKYALQDFGLRRILNAHLKVRSPYNTYINKGLPPSPICMPSIDAIDAVLHFEEHGYLYFCARPERDGHHNFARTYAEHLANARAFHRALDAARKAG